MWKQNIAIKGKPMYRNLKRIMQIKTLKEIKK